MSMPTSAGTNPAVDVGARPPRLGAVALVLAALAVPGVSITWELLLAPWGGYYTGVPLAVAAILVGLRARRRAADEGGHSVAATAAVVIGAACLALVAVWTGVEMALGIFWEG